MAKKHAASEDAQRTDSIYLTIELSDVKDEKIELTKDRFVFKGKSGDKEYELDAKLFKPVNPDESITKVLPRNIQMYIKKETEEDDYWPRILEDKAMEKATFKIDWDKWVDPDEEPEDFDKSNLDGGMGMGGGMGG
eukprot:CAMPEP_0202834788 /NCGR_PEP_ID=MMETSP1389-20130828/33781_1 /ASSEMBLY_ACC=CAM_ASM_000865 /TAXON_ID=302021 /ORGANISM="Rhodomonas sp., Strain CCMP768" /LENGTH=135 /DNA_ID=CAMNT_0049510083 /DNA_START=120 /DNA_END=525 /DNA_ORIENTATION=+